LDLIDHHRHRVALEKGLWFLLRLLGVSGEIQRDELVVGEEPPKVEVLPVWRAPVSTTTGRVRADRSRRGSMSRVIHIC
jgi:hypothetical protein